MAAAIYAILDDNCQCVGLTESLLDIPDDTYHVKIPFADAHNVLGKTYDSKKGCWIDE